LSGPSRDAGALTPHASDERDEDRRHDDPITNASQPLEIAAATIIEMTPIAIVPSRPIGSRPGWTSRPSVPTTAPTMMNQIQCMATAVSVRRRPET
jgi:hypothetical protein